MYLNNNFNPNFTALRRAEYVCKDSENNNHRLTIYELEGKDLPYVSQFVDNLELSDECAGKNDIEVKKEVIEDGFYDIKRVCHKKFIGDSDYDKTRIFMAFDGNKSCGFIMGNLPKKNDYEDDIHYSTRKESDAKETELDWLSSWTSKGGTDLKGVGKALCNELFVSTEKDGFDDVFVQSANPDVSFANIAYKRYGFNDIVEGEQKTMGEVLYNKPLLEGSYSLDYKIVPMLISKQRKQGKIDEISVALNRVELDNKSVNLDKLV